MHFPPHRPFSGMNFPQPRPYIPPPRLPPHFPPPPMRPPIHNAPLDGLGLAGSLIALVVAAIVYFTVIAPRHAEWRMQGHKAGIDPGGDREKVGNEIDEKPRWPRPRF